MKKLTNKSSDRLFKKKETFAIVCSKCNGRTGKKNEETWESCTHCGATGVEKFDIPKEGRLHDHWLTIERDFRRIFRNGMYSDETRVQIEFFTGFENFNTRPYHNYETWSSGWRVRLMPDKFNPQIPEIVASGEEIDVAIYRFLNRYIEARKKLMDKVEFPPSWLQGITPAKEKE
jgi:hypothetical protein